MKLNIDLRLTGTIEVPDFTLPGPTPADPLADWSFGPGGETVYKGVHVGGGYGTEYRWRDGHAEVLGTDKQWHAWIGELFTDNVQVLDFAEGNVVTSV